MLKCFCVRILDAFGDFSPLFTAPESEADNKPSATMAATQRTNKEMQIKSKAALAKATDPLEKLQLACLSRGATGIKGLAR